MKRSHQLKLLIVVYTALGNPVNSDSNYSSSGSLFISRNLHAEQNTIITPIQSERNSPYTIDTDMPSKKTSEAGGDSSRNELVERIKKDAEERVLCTYGNNSRLLLYFDHNAMQKGQALDIVTDRIEIEEPTYVLFIDEEPDKNFGHRCHYLLYSAETGQLRKKIPAEFPYFLQQRPKTLEWFRVGGTTDNQ